MKGFPVETRDQSHAAIVWVTDGGGYVFAVFMADDKTQLVHGSDLNEPLTSIDDLVAESWPWLDLERSETELRAMQDEAQSRRFTVDQRRLLARL